VGTVGYEDVDCDFIDFTYVRICNFFIAFSWIYDAGLYKMLFDNLLQIVWPVQWRGDELLTSIFRSAVQSASL
jgi:hypothetical protein